jgi:superfamily I DNA/RNA helicase
MHTLAQIKQREPNSSVLIIYFTHSLKQMFIVGMNELKINQRNVHFSTYISYEIKSLSTRHFDYILCDEVQDLTPEVLSLLRENSNKLYVSGDPNQSIYDRDPRTGREVVKIGEIGQETASEEYKLTTIYRLTQSVVELISSLLPSMNIFKAKTSAKKDDVTARVAKFATISDEVNYVCEKARDALSVGESCVVILPTHDDIINFSRLYAELNNQLSWKTSFNDFAKPDFGEYNQFYHKLKLHVIGNSYGDLWRANKEHKIILMTYHSSKGLDFDNVFLPFLNEDAAIHNETLFMVGLSRSKDSLTFSHSENPHAFLNSVYSECHDITSTLTTNQSTDDFDFDF